MARPRTISGSQTGLYSVRQPVEDVIPQNAMWREREPNSYDDFGGAVENVARNPINQGRQQQPGVAVGFSGTAGFEEDFTLLNMEEDLEDFLCAEMRRKSYIAGTAILADGLTVPAGGAAYVQNTLLHVRGATVGTNNGLKVAASGSIGTKINVNGLTATADDAFEVRRVGHQFASGDAEIDASGDLPKLITTAFDLTTLGLIPGEIVYLGGDATANQFAQTVNSGWCRVFSVSANAIEFDKTDATFVDDDGTGKTIRLFIGEALKNEADPALQVYNHKCFRRTLGAPDKADQTTHQSQVLLNCTANEFTLNINEKDKLTAGMSYIIGDERFFDDDGTVDPGGTVLPLGDVEVFTTTSNITRARLALFDKDNPNSNPTPLYSLFQEGSLTINNNISENNAVTKMGVYDTTPGQFMVEMTTTMYFVNVDIMDAIRNSRRASYLQSMYLKNTGVAIDLPMIILSNEGLNVEANEAITMEVMKQAASGRGYHSDFNHTIFVTFFHYLPSRAAN